MKTAAEANAAALYSINFVNDHFFKKFQKKDKS